MPERKFASTRNRTHNHQVMSPPRSPLRKLGGGILILMHQQQTAFEKIVGKEEIARNEQFFLFPQCFLLNQKLVSPSVNIFDIISFFAAELKEPKIGMSGKGLKRALLPYANASQWMINFPCLVKQGT